MLTSMNSQESRRDFIKKSIVIGTGISILPNLTYGITSSEYEQKLKVGLIGVGLEGPII